MAAAAIAQSTQQAADIAVENHGSIFLFQGLTAEGQAWLEDNLVDPMMFGGAFAVEHRCAEDIAYGAVSDGLRLV